MSAPQWIEAIGTLGAFLTGGALLVRELNRDERRRQDEEAEQARQIVVWMGFVDIGYAETPYGITIRNNSPGPVFDVAVEWTGPMLAGGAIVPSDTIDVLEPGTERSVAMRTSDGREVDTVVQRAFARVRFRDMGGRVWHRWTTGALTRSLRHEVPRLVSASRWRRLLLRAGLTRM